MRPEDVLKAERLDRAIHAIKGRKFRSKLGWAFWALAGGRKGLVLGVWLDGPLAGCEARVPLCTLTRMV